MTHLYQRNSRWRVPLAGNRRTEGCSWWVVDLLFSGSNTPLYTTHKYQIRRWKHPCWDLPKYALPAGKRRLFSELHVFTWSQKVMKLEDGPERIINYVAKFLKISAEKCGSCYLPASWQTSDAECVFGSLSTLSNQNQVARGICSSKTPLKMTSIRFSELRGIVPAP